ncbi:MAG: hypothetical protein IJI22_02345 [Bacilli bacterium]|nr:hypothetical protein [Bacilli bacterium]
MAKKKKKKNKKTHHYIRTLCMIVLVLVLAYFIFSHDLLSPHLNELTTSYISFNNSYSTDMLKINNIQKMKDEKGASTKNKGKLTIKITGSNKNKYELVVYPISNEVNPEYVKFSLNDGKNTINNKLSEMPTSKDGGIIIYTNNINKDNNITLNMWISTEYNDKIKNNSYEVKILEKV